MKTPPPTLTKKDLASRWGCTDRTVRRILARHTLACVPLSGKLKLYLQRDVEALEKRLRKESLRKKAVIL